MPTSTNSPENAAAAGVCAPAPKLSTERLNEPEQG